MNKAIFIRNPKCATISIRSVVKQPQFNVRFDEVEKHQTALKWQCTASDYNQHFVFSVCRNPYDRLLSGWLFICRRKLDKHKAILEKYGSNFERFVLDLEKDFSMLVSDVDMVTWPQYLWLTDVDKNLIVNEIGRFENLSSWWVDFSKRRGWPIVGLPRSNTTKHGPWKEYYSPDMIKVVNKCYADDFKLLKYEML